MIVNVSSNNFQYKNKGLQFEVRSYQFGYNEDKPKDDLLNELVSLSTPNIVIEKEDVIYTVGDNLITLTPYKSDVLFLIIKQFGDLPQQSFSEGVYNPPM